jgi:hypothetical protein
MNGSQGAGRERKIMLPFGRKSKPLIGLDISSSAVKLVELSRHGNGFRAWSVMPPKACPLVPSTKKHR